jgi:hypothetical protein
LSIPHSGVGSIIPLVGDAEHAILSNIGEDMQATRDHIGERRAIIFQDGREPDVQLVLVILGAHVDCRPLPHRHSEPRLAQHMCNRALQIDERLANRPVAREQIRLLEGDAILDGPLPLRYRVLVPGGHVDERKLWLLVIDDDPWGAGAIRLGLADVAALDVSLPARLFETVEGLHWRTAPKARAKMTWATSVSISLSASASTAWCRSNSPACHSLARAHDRSSKTC